MKNSGSCFLLLFLCSLGLHAQYTETINSNRPGTSQGAYAVGPGVLQFEAGGKYGRNEHILLKTSSDIWGIDYMARFGLIYEQLEINVMGSFLETATRFQMGREERTATIRNFEFNSLGVKYLVYDPYKYRKERKPNLYSWNAPPKIYWSDLIPAVALYGGVNVNFGKNPYLQEGEPSFSPRLALITQHNWGRWVLVMNFAGDQLGSDFPTYSIIGTLTHSLGPRFALFTEFQEIVSDLYADEVVRAGMAYLVHRDLQLDLSGLTNFKHTPSRWEVNFGVSYRFDWHNQDQYLELDEEMGW